MKKVSNKFHREKIIIIFLGEFCGHGIETLSYPNFSGLNPFLSLPSIATDNGKQFQSLNIALNGKTEPGFRSLKRWQ